MPNWCENRVSVHGEADQVKDFVALVNNYKEEVVAKKMKSKNIEIDINLGTGKESATIWTCDLTKEYIKINADYRS